MLTKDEEILLNALYLMWRANPGVYPASTNNVPRTERQDGWNECARWSRTEKGKVINALPEHLHKPFLAIVDEHAFPVSIKIDEEKE